MTDDRANETNTSTDDDADLDELFDWMASLEPGDVVAIEDPDLDDAERQRLNSVLMDLRRESGE